jgi:hypothetical protein
VRLRRANVAAEEDFGGFDQKLRRWMMKVVSRLVAGRLCRDYCWRA